MSHNSTACEIPTPTPNTWTYRHTHTCTIFLSSLSFIHQFFLPQNDNTDAFLLPSAWVLESCSSPPFCAKQQSVLDRCQTQIYRLFHWVRHSLTGTSRSISQKVAPFNVPLWWVLLCPEQASGCIALTASCEKNPTMDPTPSENTIKVWYSPNGVI